MPDITGTGTNLKVKKIFGFIWETGRNILEMMPGTSMALAMCFREVRFFSNGNLDMLPWCSDNTT